MVSALLSAFVLLFILGLVIYKRGFTQGKGLVVHEKEKMLHEHVVYEKVSVARWGATYVVVLNDVVGNMLLARIMSADPPRKFRVLRKGLKLVLDPYEEEGNESPALE